MVFSGATFLFYFLPAIVGLYLLAPRRLRNPLLLAASLLFYTWGSGALVGLLFISIVVDYGMGSVAGKGIRDGRPNLTRGAVTGSVLVNLALLGWFKYAGWLIGAASDAGLWTGAVPEITLPIGISFFTFQSMSYTIDIARQRTEPLHNPIDFALYVTLFPQLIAGPIVRFHEISAQMTNRPHGWEQVSVGTVRFAHGLVKKVIIADAVSGIADAGFLIAETDGDPSAAVAWLAALAYTVQIYFDFSGYSDMAIGLGTMFGFRFPENFNRPYSAVSVTDFWRRWHITLSNWFRDYLYIPLGGGRGTALSIYRNLLVVFVLTGIWHGANWTFLIWGLYHGVWLLIERRFGWRNTAAVGQQVFRRATTFLIVVFGWVLFRAPDFETATTLWSAMVGFSGAGDLSQLELALTIRGMITLLAALGFSLLAPRTWTTGPWLAQANGARPAAARFSIVGIGVPVALLLVAAGTASPFLYFQF